jgi:hypothetical protein
VYTTCPKCGHKLPEGSPAAECCPACGIVFAKWLQRKLSGGRPSPAAAEVSSGGRPSPAALVFDRLFCTEDKVNPFYFAGRALVFIGLTIWGWHFISLDFTRDYTPYWQSFMHNVNLIFHEAGHMFFRPFGWFMTILGGSLGQLIMPAIVMLTFLWKKNPFGASVGLWWLGQSFMDLTPYIDDALVQQLVLLGGRTGVDQPGYHDWNNILGDLNMLERAREFAHVSETTGNVLILTALAWGAFLLWRQFRRVDW